MGSLWYHFKLRQSRMGSLWYHFKLRLEPWYMQMCRCRTGSYREPLTPLHRSPEQVVGALQIHLLLDSCPVGLHSLDGDVELFCNFAGGLSFSGQFEHLQLPVAEKFERIIRVGSPVAGQLHQQFVSDLGAEKETAIQHLTCGSNQRIASLQFHEITSGTCTDSPLGIELLIVAGDNEHSQIREPGQQILDQLDTVHARKRDVDNRKIRAQFRYNLHGLFSRLRLANHLERHIGLKGHGHPFTHQRVVVDNDNALFTAHSYSCG